MKKWLLIWFFFGSVSLAVAQTTTSSIVGNVSDAEGNPVADALVTAAYTPTGVIYHVATDERGHYVLSGVMAGGPYDIKVDDFAHKSLVRQHVYAPLDGRVEVDFKFRSDEVQLHEVVIEAEGALMGSPVQGLSTHVDGALMDRVPTVTRSLTDLIKFVPQASSSSGSFMLAGGNYRGSAVTVDGANYNNMFGIGSSLPAGGNPISLDAVEEINVCLTPFDVRYSGFNGGSVNVVTKHGTNQWHASLYDYITGSKVQGQKIGSESVSQNNSLNNLTGLTLSGPIIKDKLFFFLNAEYVADVTDGVRTQARTNSEEAYGGSTGLARPTVEQMTTIKDFLSNQFGYDPGRYQDYRVSTPDYKILGRIDWNIAENHQFYLRFSHSHTASANSPSSSMSPLGSTNTSFLASDGNTYSFNRYSAGRTSTYALPFESAYYRQVANHTSLAAELNSAFFEGRGHNTFRATWSYQNEPRSYVGDLFPTVDILEPYTDAAGNKQYALYTTFGVDPFTYANLRRVNTINFTDEFTYSKGIHELMLGVQYEHNRIVNGYMQGGAGWYLYESWEAFQNDVLSGSTTPNAFMITHANMDDPTQTIYPSFDRNQFSVYLQDEMDFSRYFQLSLGLRFEVPIYSFLYDNNNAEFDSIAQANPNTSFAGLSTDKLPNTSVNVSPRVGFTWDVLHNRKLMLHGGTGLFTGSLPSVWLVSAAGNSNCLQYQYIANSSTGLSPIHFMSDRADIINAIYAGTPFTQQALPAPTAATFFDRNFRMPSSWKSSLAADIALPLGVKANIEGLFSYTFNEVYAQQLGYRQEGSTRMAGEPEDRLTYVSENIKNSAGAKMGGYLLTNATNLHGWYASITGRLSRDFVCGLNLLAAYTYSSGRSVNDGVGDQVSTLATVSNVQGSNVPELGFNANVAPHHLILSAGYTLSLRRSTTKIALFYEGLNTGIYSGYFTSRVSYCAKNNDLLGGYGLLYVPTEEELAAMPFTSDENREAFGQLISSDDYLSAHRGEYALRNCATAPFTSRVNLRLTHEFYFNVAGRRQAIELGVDLNNIANLLNSDWGLYKEFSNANILTYASGKYTYTPSEWHNYNNLRSTWQLLGHIRYSF